ncbi:MAG TPA: pyridoxamine 5'-phosphate oxidase family protein [Mycobacterium sp.]|nr:pyridoxamine 5'-phosphate oxidase family protein [Mycobacterium sp.]
MAELKVVAPAFVEMAHRIVWCSVATVDKDGRPRSRILHPVWEWADDKLIGWIATGPTPTKRAHLEKSPFVSCSYWADNHDTCAAECRAEWHFDDDTRIAIWDRFKHAPPPVGYDPGIIPAWESPTSENFAVLRLDPWRLRVFPGTFLLTGGAEGEVLVWEGHA